jgi:hypothetical protein
VEHTVSPDAASVTTFYLEMRAPAELRPAHRQDALDVRECEIPQFEVNRSVPFRRRRVGMDRQAGLERRRVALGRSRTAHLDRVSRGRPQTTSKLHKRATKSRSRIRAAPAFIGRGFGGDLLSRCIECAGSGALRACGCTPARSITHGAGELPGARHADKENHDAEHEAIMTSDRAVRPHASSNARARQGAHARNVLILDLEDAVAPG